MRKKTIQTSQIAVLLCLVGPGGLSCKTSREPLPETAPVTPSPPASTQLRSATSLMGSHGMRAVQVRDAIALADLDDARRGARALARVRISPESPEFGERLIDMHVAAASVAEAIDLAGAAKAFGQLTKSCGACHARLQGPTWVEVPAAPQQRGTSGDRMLRHAWAMDQMWLGLIGNSEPPWRAGARVFANGGFDAKELVPRKAPTQAVDAFAASLRTSGREAQEASDSGVRAEIFGELLTACAGCHERTR